MTFNRRQSHRRSQDFVRGAPFLHQKSHDLFLVITVSYIIIIRYIPPPILPSHLVCGGAPHQIQPHFCLIPTKMPTPLHALATPMGRVQQTTREQDYTDTYACLLLWPWQWPWHDRIYELHLDVLKVPKMNFLRQGFQKSGHYRS